MGALSLLFVALALAFSEADTGADSRPHLDGQRRLAAIAGVKLLPKKPFESTRRRIETGVESVKGRVR